MDRLVSRKRLLVRLGDRHRLAVIAVVAPAGFGKSVLLGQTLAEGPSKVADSDVSYVCGPEDSQPGHLAHALIRSCRGREPRGNGTRIAIQAGRAKDVAEALEASCAPGRHIALTIDNFEGSGSEGEGLLRALLERLPARCHLLISGRRLPRIGLPSHIAAGTGLLIDTAELAFNADEISALAELSGAQNPSNRELAAWPALASLIMKGRDDLAGAYISEMVLSHCEPAVAIALAGIASVAGCQDALLEAVIGAAWDEGISDGPLSNETLNRVDPVIDEIKRLPFMDTRAGIWPHPIWSAVTMLTLTPLQRERIVVAKVHGLLQVGAIHDAGHLATASNNPRALSLVVRAALSTQPPKASFADLGTWATSELMSRYTTEQKWLRAVVDLQLGDTDGTGRRHLEEVRQAFEASRDEDAEISVLLHLGVIARATSDSATLRTLLERGVVLAAGGNPLIRALVALGHAVAAQLAGDPKGAIASLERIPPGLLAGEWASQALMIRGTNLLLAGRIEEAITALNNSTGEGSDATCSIAHDLLSTAKWYHGDRLEAIEETEISERLALSSGTLRAVQQRRAWKACLLAATGQSQQARQVLEQLDLGRRDSDDDETQALVRITEILLLVKEANLDEARKLLEAMKVPLRPTRSSVWKTALEVALEPHLVSARPPGVPRIPAMQAAMAAGVAAADHLAGGALVRTVHRAYLPECWCEPANTVVISLAGTCMVTRNGRAVDHPAWGRLHVRELCLHLALAENQTRTLVAAALWPDLPDRDAGRNLRVTLMHLLDVLDPDRGKSAGSPFIVDADGSLVLSRESDLHIDLWDFERHANAVLALPDHERPALLAHARRMVAIDHGPLLGGAPIGEWLEPYRRRRDDLRINASIRAGRLALEAADNRLAEALALSVLDVDQWSEQAHSLVIESRIYGGDVDGARRAFKQALAAFDDLGVSSSLATGALTFRLGL